jgi:hypothetical protein
MKRGANVRSLDALRDAKAAVVEFKEVSRVAISEANADVMRTHWWLQHDQLTFWKAEIRRRTEKVNQAKSELYRAQLAAMDHQAQCVEQKKLLARAEAALEEAGRKLKAVQRWIRIFDKEVMLFKGACQTLSRTVDADLPLGEARLDHMMDRLEAYLKLNAPARGPRKAPPAPDAKKKDEPA